MDECKPLFPGKPVAVVVAMANDKDHVGFMRMVIRSRPAAVVLTQVPISGGQERAAGVGQELTLVHFSAQRKRFLWSRGCIQGLCRGCVEGVRGY